MNNQIIQKNCLFLIDQAQFTVFLEEKALLEDALPASPAWSTMTDDYETAKLSIWAQLNSERLVSVRNWEKSFVYPANYYLMEIMYNHPAVTDFLQKYAYYAPSAYVLAHFILQKTTEGSSKIMDTKNVQYFNSFDSQTKLYYDAVQKTEENERFQSHQRKLIHALIKDRNHNNVYGKSVKIAVRNAAGWLIAHKIEPLKMTVSDEEMKTF